MLYKPDAAHFFSYRFVIGDVSAYNFARLVFVGRSHLGVFSQPGASTKLDPINHLNRCQNDGTYTVKDKRPVNLDIGTIRLPITAWTSITHRASGVFIFAGMAVLIWMLDASLESPESFAALHECLASPGVKFVLWAIVSGLIYHSVAGVKHLVMDMGIGETMEGGVLGAKLVIATSIVLILLAGVWIW